MLRDKKIIFLINHVSFFISHRLPIALRALEEGCSVELITGKAGSLIMEKQALKVLKKYDIKHTRVSFESSSINIFTETKSLIEIYKLLKTKEPDILHMASPKAITYGGIVSNFLRIPGLVFSISGLGFIFTKTKNNSLFRNSMRLILRILFRFIFNHNKNIKVIVQNNDDRNFFIEKKIVRPRQLVLIKGSGVDLNTFSDISFKEKDKIILFPARVILDKGIREFILAANKLKLIYPDWDFLVAGAYDYNNPTSIPFEEIQNLISNNSVKFLGHVNNINELYRHSSIVCLPSYREGMPKAVLEAQAAGCAIVTTDVIGCRESIERDKTGYLVSPYNIKELYEALEKLIVSKRKREDFGRSGIEFVKKNFDLNLVLDKVIGSYELLLKK
jgi:glycosyltransferase involved in cell wall biosynthesis